MTFIEQTKLQIIIMFYSRPGNIHLAKPEQDGLKTIYNDQLPPTYLPTYLHRLLAICCMKEAS